MADKNFRTAVGFVYAGPYDKVVGESKEPVVTYIMSAIGLNGDVDLNLDFFTNTYGKVDIALGEFVAISGKVRNAPGKDKEGNEVMKHYVTVNKLVQLGDNILSRSDLSRSDYQPPTPKQRRAPAPHVNIEDEFE